MCISAGVRATDPMHMKPLRFYTTGPGSMRPLSAAINSMTIKHTFATLRHSNWHSIFSSFVALCKWPIQTGGAARKLSVHSPVHGRRLRKAWAHIIAFISSIGVAADSFRLSRGKWDVDMCKETSLESDEFSSITVLDPPQFNVNMHRLKRHPPMSPPTHSAPAISQATPYYEYPPIRSIRPRSAPLPLAHRERRPPPPPPPPPRYIPRRGG